MATQIRFITVRNSPPEGHFMRDLLKTEKFPTNTSCDVCPHESPPSGGDASIELKVRNFALWNRMLLTINTAVR